MIFFGKVSLVFKYISRLFRLDPGYFMLSVFSQICNAVAAVLMLWLPKIILDEFVGDRNITKIIICVAVMAVSAIFICVVEKITETLGFRLSHLQNHVRIERTSKMAELDMAQVESPAVHDLSALAAEVNNRGTINQVTNRVMGLFSAIPMLITTIIILAEVNLWLVPISVVFAVASVIVSAHIEKRVFENHMYSETLFRAENYFAGVFSNKDFRKEIRFFRIHDWLVAKHEKKYGELLANEQKLNNYVAGVTAPVEILSIIKDYAIYLYLAFRVLAGKITIGMFTQGFQATGQLTASIKSVMDFFTYFTNESRYIRAWVDFMGLKSNIESWKGDGLIKEIPASDTAEIRLENVSFRYSDDGPEVLRNIDYSFHLGKVYSVIGANGAGKTTLLNLIGRLYDVTDGRITYNGMPIRDFDIDAYRGMFSSVFQQTHVFAMSIAENIALDRFDGSAEQKEKITSILSDLGMGDYIAGLPDGVDTQLGKEFDENGVIMSGGQLQRLSIARALFRDARILLLDEPSSALDPLAEDEFFGLLQSISAGRMIFYVSHRLLSAALADTVVFIKDNHIAASGKHEELMKTCPDYNSFYMAQAKYYKTAET